MTRISHHRSLKGRNALRLYFRPIPASFFGIILGLVGLGNCWRVAAKIWQLPAWIGEIIMLTAISVWLILLLLYSAALLIAWLQVAQGNLTLNNESLQAGDGVQISGAEDLTIRADTGTEVLIFDLA